MEKNIKKIVTYKERDYNGLLGELQFWEESDNNLKTSVSTSNTWDFKEYTQGLHLGQLTFNKRNVTPKMAKKIYKLIKEALQSESNPKVKTVFIAN